MVYEIACSEVNHSTNGIITADVEKFKDVMEDVEIVSRHPLAIGRTERNKVYRFGTERIDVIPDPLTI